MHWAVTGTTDHSRMKLLEGDSSEGPRTEQGTPLAKPTSTSAQSPAAFLPGLPGECPYASPQTHRGPHTQLQTWDGAAGYRRQR